MARTSPVICFGAYNALGYKQDSSLSCSVALQTWSKLNDLKLHGVFNTYPYATFEPDYWMLDGSFKIKPADETGIHAGIMGTVQSNSAGVFASTPALTITFGSVHNTDGLILQFDVYSGDWCNSITVAYYDASNALITTHNYAPSAALFSVAQVVTAFKKIIITFNSTNKPFRYLRLLDIDYTLGTYFSGTEIKACSVVEEINPVSVEMPFNTCEFRLLTDNPQFSIIAPAGGYALLQQRQPVYVYEIVDGVVVLIGKFFVDKWNNLSEKEISISAKDMIGVMDTMSYIGIWAQTPETVSTFLTNELLTPMGISHSLDASFTSVALRGILLSGSRRHALQQLCISIGAYATCARSEVVNILPVKIISSSTNYDYVITAAEKSSKQEVQLKPLVTGLEIVSHSFSLDSVKTKYIYGPVVVTAPATLVIEFSELIYSLTGTVTGATVVSFVNNILTLSVTVTGTVSVTVPEIVDAQNLYKYHNTVPPSVALNILKISDAIFITDANAQADVTKIYGYYVRRYIQKTRLYAHLIKVGDTARIATVNNKHIVGAVEKMKIDLSGGFVSDVDIVGLVGDPLVHERSTGAGNGATPMSTASVSHQVDNHGQRLLVALIAVRAYQSVTSVTFGAQSFIKYADVQAGTSNNPRAELWYLIAPNIGTSTVTVTLTGADFVEAAILGFHNADQVSPLGIVATAHALSGNPSASAPADSGDIVIDVISYAGTSATQGAGQTLLGTLTSDGNWKLSASKEPGSSPSISMDWTNPANGAWAQIAVAVKGA